MPQAPVLCVFGTASDVGKSLVVTALCRLLRDRGVSVAPFKAQNMSNNSGVTHDGLEMGRAQFVQAQAAGIVPEVDMNPVLLKPTGERKSQVVLLGKPIGDATTREYFQCRSQLRAPAMAALTRLRERFELVVVEGAGSCAEVNLRSRDFVNFSVAHAANASVLLVADIDRGGVFAQVVGSLAVMLPEDRARVRGVLINRFRGDPQLFEDGVTYLEKQTGIPVLGVLPYAENLRIEAEDGLDLQPLLDPPVGANEQAQLRIAVVSFPRISNFTDFEPWSHCPGAALHYLSRPRDLNCYDLVILPGSKSVRADLQWLRQTGWAEILLKRAAEGRKILGICGGYQMLGDKLSDPLGVEGTVGDFEGLGLLKAVTIFGRNKTVRRTRAECALLGTSLAGYEIHMGQTRSEQAPFLESVQSSPRRDGACEGAVSQEGHILGTYLHGLFEQPDALRAFVRWLAPAWEAKLPDNARLGYQREAEIDALAQHFEATIDFSRLLQALGVAETVTASGAFE